MDASILNVAHQVGYPTLVLLIIAESAGIPVPGETALITAAILAGQHRLQIALVIALAAAAAIVGDNLGYLVGRKGGRWLLQRPGPFARQRARVLEIGEPFFAHNGPRAVFLWRWILGLRTWASWLAGASRMPWHSFLLWNAAGAITWAAAIGTVAYYLGNSAGGVAALLGVTGVMSALGVPAAISFAWSRNRRPVPAPSDPELPPHDLGAICQPTPDDAVSGTGRDQPRTR
jgi:membrane protein DedA with SNARE-associated domain